jgi:K+-transporting ATPase ATPase C chain
MIRLFLWLVFLTGIVYPLIVTVLTQLFVPEQANGSFIVSKGVKIGSSLIAQKFDKEIYFWPRPSAVDFNPLPSGGSNLGPTSYELKKKVEERKKRMGDNAPLELIYASASGLDPHLSREAIDFQIDRVAKARGLDRNDILKILEKLDGPLINVLQLNLILDEKR